MYDISRRQSLSIEGVHSEIMTNWVKNTHTPTLARRTGREHGEAWLYASTDSVTKADRCEASTSGSTRERFVSPWHHRIENNDEQRSKAVPSNKQKQNHQICHYFKFSDITSFPCTSGHDEQRRTMDAKTWPTSTKATMLEDLTPSNVICVYLSEHTWVAPERWSWRKRAH